jgi:hypothetical protein
VSERALLGGRLCGHGDCVLNGVSDGYGRVWSRVWRGVIKISVSVDWASVGRVAYIARGVGVQSVGLTVLWTWECTTDIVLWTIGLC